ALYKHKSEQEVIRQRSWFETTLQSIGDAILVADSKQTVQYMNDDAARLLHTTRESCVGQPLSSVFRLCRNGSGLPVEDLAESAATEDFPKPFPMEVH